LRIALVSMITCAGFLAAAIFETYSCLDASLYAGLRLAMPIVTGPARPLARHAPGHQGSRPAARRASTIVYRHALVRRVSGFGFRVGEETGEGGEVEHHDVLAEEHVSDEHHGHPAGHALHARLIRVGALRDVPVREGDFVLAPCRAPAALSAGYTCVMPRGSAGPLRRGVLRPEGRRRVQEGCGARRHRRC
jgi:hypothetical protein